MNIFKLFGFVTTLCIIAGCAEIQTASDQAVNAPEYIEAKLDQDFVITLASNPTTGYCWGLAQPLPGMLKLQSQRYKPPKEVDGRVGAGGTEEWTFRAVRSGKATIAFEYVRPWEKNSPPAKQQIFSVLAR